jgi:hypothetical protein
MMVTGVEIPITTTSIPIKPLLRGGVVNVTGVSLETDPSGPSSLVEVAGSPTVIASDHVTVTVRDGTNDCDDGNISCETTIANLDLDGTGASSFHSNTTITHVIDDEVSTEIVTVTYLGPRAGPTVVTAPVTNPVDDTPLEDVNGNEAFDTGDMQAMYKAASGEDPAVYDDLTHKPQNR